LWYNVGMDTEKARIICGDALTVLRTLPASSVHCCVTSPPYWGLRDYGVEGQLGLEKTPEEYVGKLVDVFREVRRVLRDDGTLWLNLGDSYSSSTKGDNRTREEKLSASGLNLHHDVALAQSQHDVVGVRRVETGLKPKDLVGIPWRVAFALQADGWYLRSDIIWAKPNPMPESVTDRPTKSHEYVFLLSKNRQYWYDAEAIKEPSITNDTRKPYTSNGAKQLDGRPAEQWHGGEQRGRGGQNSFRGQGANRDTDTGPANRNGRDMKDIGIGATRNARSVWTVATKPFKGAHFATFPPDLIRPCILAGCPVGGTVLDPFFGAGTVGLVAKREGRDYIGIELNPEYVEMAENRIGREIGLRLDLTVASSSVVRDAPSAP